MCGIAGHIGRTRPSESQITAALRCLKHRGPDDTGLWTQDLGDGYTCTLVFTRLAIQDLTPAASQPFHSGPVTMVFNGEIYNFVELRSSMKAQGEPFVTDGDTEVLARLLARRGEAALDDVDGMFALAWWADDKRRLTIARDAIGEKPLHFHRMAHDFWFASEVTSLAAIAGRHFEPNLDQIRRFLTNGYRVLHKNDETFHLGVQQVEPGQIIRVDARGAVTSARHFWKPQSELVNDVPPYEVAVEEVRERLLSSLRLRLRADVPVALSLSGGIDSTALLAMSVLELMTPLKTYTVRSGDANYDDSSVAIETARLLGVSHDLVDVRDHDFLAELERQVRGRGAPVITISSFAQNLLMREVASSGDKVILEGIGADEIFAGYYDHHNAFLGDLARSDQDLHRQALSDWGHGAGKFTRNPFLRDPDYLVRDPYARDHLHLDSEQFGSLLLERPTEGFEELSLTPWILRNRMLNEIAEETLPVLLGEADANAMASSVENRSPFLDRNLVDWVFGLPETYLIRRGFGKSLLRDAVSPWVPPAVLWDQEKRGFNLSIGTVLKWHRPESRDEILRESPIWQVVDRDRLRQWLANDEHLTESQSKFLFSFLSCRFFLEQTSWNP